MAYLMDAMRQKIRRGLCRLWSRNWTPIGVSKEQLKAAVDATDAWIDDNQASYNSALPEPAKSELTQAQKVVLFCAVALARVDEAMLRCVFGEVD